jgi:hypothetical protein
MADKGSAYSRRYGGTAPFRRGARRLRSGPAPAPAAIDRRRSISRSNSFAVSSETGVSEPLSGTCNRPIAPINSRRVRAAAARAAAGASEASQTARSVATAIAFRSSDKVSAVLSRPIHHPACLSLPPRSPQARSLPTPPALPSPSRIVESADRASPTSSLRRPRHHVRGKPSSSALRRAGTSRPSSARCTGTAGGQCRD